MKIPTKKVGSFELPVLGLGTWRMGGGGRGEVSHAQDEQEIAAIKAVLKMGITHIDTAEMYGSGHAEELIAVAIKNFDRKSLFITSKVLPEHLRYDDVISACKASLKRLKISYLDLYLIHAPNSAIILSESLKAMEFLYEQGLIRNIGVSNFEIPELEEAVSRTKYAIVNNQIHYSLSAREYEENGTLEYCLKNQILVTAYRPVGVNLEAGINLDRLQPLAQKYGKTPIQVALNWVINRPNIVALVKTSRPEHMRENLGALGWRLEKGDEEWLDEDFPRGAVRRGPRM